MAGYENRQDWDHGTWPELDEKVQELTAFVFSSGAGMPLNLMVFVVASQAGGCRHCQAHGSVGLNLMGLELEKVQGLWDFERSELFDERERAALRFAQAAGQAPNAVTPEHHAELRAHFTDEEVRGLLASVAVSGFLNRFNDSLAVVTDAFSRDWALENLAAVGWDPGKHVGADHERRPGPPFAG